MVNLPKLTELYIGNINPSIDNAEILGWLREHGPLIHLRRFHYFAFVTMTQANAVAAVQTGIQDSEGNPVHVDYAKNPRPMNPQVRIDDQEPNACRGHLLGHCIMNCPWKLLHPLHRDGINYDEVLNKKKNTPHSVAGQNAFQSVTATITPNISADTGTSISMLGDSTTTTFDVEDSSGSDVDVEEPRTTRALAIESFSDGTFDIILEYENVGECFVYEGSQYRSDVYYRVPAESLNFGNEIVTISREMLTSSSKSITDGGSFDLLEDTTTFDVEEDSSDTFVVEEPRTSQREDDHSFHSFSSLFGVTNFTNFQRRDCSHGCSNSACNNGLSSEEDSGSVHPRPDSDSTVNAFAEEKANWRNRKRFVPSRRKPATVNWEQKSGISEAQLEALKNEALKKLQNHQATCPDLVQYLSDLVKIAVPLDMLNIIILHCALQWGRGHISANCGGGHALGDNVSWETLGNCSLDGLNVSSIKMGFTADSIGVVNGRQSTCPTESKTYSSCPPIDENDLPGAVVGAMNIAVSFFNSVQVSVFLFSAAGTTTGVNEHIYDKIIPSNTHYITKCIEVLKHIQFLRRGFHNQTLLSTSEKMSKRFQQISDSLLKHLAKCGVEPPKASLFEAACEDKDLPMINDHSQNVTEDSIQKLVKYHSRQEDILSYCRSNPDSPAIQGPTEVRKYLRRNFNEIKTCELEYQKLGRRECVPDSPEDVSCSHLLSHMATNPRRKANRHLLSNMAANTSANRRKRKKTDDESDDVNKSTLPRLKSRRCSLEGCNKLALSGGKCSVHGGGTRCSAKGCNKLAKSSGKCSVHGGGTRCSAKGCNKRAQSGGKCSGHGGGKRCSAKGCDKLAQSGGKCSGHGGRRCSLEGCNKLALSGGKCTKHGRS